MSSSSSHAPVIVFGPTGAVGSSTARTASELGATVILAMRDPSKPIPALDDSSASGFKRVQADLTQPETIQHAVSSTGAKRAFIYLIHGTDDHMRAGIEALHKAGIEFVVFNSSFSVQGDPKDEKPEDHISYVHAQVELNLRDVFGPDNFVAVRPAYFASNTVQYKGDLAKGKIRLLSPEAHVDYITPEDIGRVAGTVLVKDNGPDPSAGGIRSIFLYGPQIITQREAMRQLARGLGKPEPEIEVLDEEAAMKMMVEERKMPTPIAGYLVKNEIAGGRAKGEKQVYGLEVKDQDRDNIARFAGGNPMVFEDWVKKNKALFAA